VAILGVWAASATVTADGAAGHTAGADRLDFAPIVSTVLTTPTPVKGTDGRFHIVYEVVKAHGGTVEVTSQEDAGTTFTVRLPKPRSTDHRHAVPSAG